MAKVAALSIHISGVWMVKRLSMPSAAAIGERAGEAEENQIAAGHETGRQFVVGDLDGGFAGERAVGDGGQRIELYYMVVAQPRLPFRAQRRQRSAQLRPNVELDRMALAVVEADGFHARESFQRPGQADGGILPAGEQDEGAIGAKVSGHRSIPLLNPTSATRSNQRCGHYSGRGRRFPSSPHPTSRNPESKNSPPTARSCWCAGSPRCPAG